MLSQEQYDSAIERMKELRLMGVAPEEFLQGEFSGWQDGKRVSSADLGICKASSVDSVAGGILVADDGKKASKCPASWRNVEIEQLCELGFTMEKVKEFVQWDSVKKYAYILHDKDEDAKNHVHLMLSFKSPCKTESILQRMRLFFGADWGVQVLEKIKNWSSAIAYLTHKNAPQKHQYSDNEVVANFDALHESQNAAGVRDKVFEELKQGIEVGRIRQYNLFADDGGHLDTLFYAKNKRIIDALFDAYFIKNNIGDRNMDVIYVQGKSGYGKTTTAKKWCDGNKLSYCISSSSNDFAQDYRGQDVLILDDFRPDTCLLADFLKLTDNNTLSSVKSRYSNKNMIYCKFIIITSTLCLDDFVHRLRKQSDEDTTQVYRRISCVWDVLEDVVNVQTVGKKIMYCFENPAKGYNADAVEKELNKRMKLDCFVKVKAYDDNLPF